MKIKTRVKIAGALSVCVLLAYGGWAIHSHRELNRLTHELQEAQKITNKIFLLQTLSNDYLSFPMARAQMQWSAVYEELLRLLEEPESGGLQRKYGIFDTADRLKAVEVTFSGLRSLQEISGGKIPETETGRELENRLRTQLWLAIQEISGKTVRMDEEIMAKLATTQRGEATFDFLSIMVLGIILLSAGVFLQRSVVKPVLKLHEGTEVIGAGNLDHRVGIEARGEVGELARAFDRMTANLQEVTVSRDELIREVAERRRVEEALRRSNRRLDLLAETAARLLAAESPQRVVDSLCREVLEFLDCDVFFNFLVTDDQAGLMRLNACGGIPEEEAQKIEWLEYGQAVCGCAARDRRRIAAEDILNTDDPRTALVQSYGVQAYACHPLMVAGRILGTLSFGTRKKTSFAPDELALMESVANQVAIAMERQQAEEALRESEERLRRLGDNLPRSAVYQYAHELDGSVRFLYLSAGIEPLNGVSVQEALQDAGALHRQILPEYYPRLVEGEERSKRDLSDVDLELQMRRTDGQVRWMHLRSRPRRLPDGRTVWDGVQTDITARKRDEETLRQNADQIRRQLAEIEAIYRSASLGLCVLDRDLRYIRINEQLAEMNGVPVEAHLGRTVREMVPGLADQAEEMVRRILATGEPILDIEFRGTTPAQPGVERIWLEHWVPIKDNGQIIAIGVMTEEITELKAAEQALRESEERLRLAQIAARVGVWEWRPQEGVLNFTPELEMLYGLQPGSVQRYQDWRALVHPEDLPRMEAERDEAVAQHRSFDLEFRILHGSGQTRWIQSQGGAYYDEDGSPSRVLAINIDITRRKLLEQALRERREDLNRAQAVAQTGSWRLDVRKNALTWSDENHRIFGIPPGTTLTYETFLSTLHPEDREYVDQKWTAALKGEPYDIEHRIIVNGSVKWVRERAELEFDPEGQLLGGFGTTQDITERKRAEEKIHHLASFPLLDPNPVLEVDEEGRVLFANPAARQAAETLGLSQEGRDFLPPNLKELFTQARSGGPRQHSFDLNLQGRVFTVQISFPHDLPIARIYARDITARKAAEEALRQSEERFRKIFENAATGIAITDGAGRFQRCNPAYCDLLGYTEEELCRIEFVDLIHPEDREANLAKVRGLNAGEVPFFQVENRYIRKDGQPVWVHKFVSLLPDVKGGPAQYVALVTDITERKRIFAELEQRVAERTADLQHTVEQLQWEISERLAVEEALERERQRLFDVFETIPAYVVLLAPDYTVRVVNQEFGRRFGKAEEGQRCYEFLFGRQDPCPDCRTFKVLETNQPEEWEWLGPDGRTYAVYDYPFADADGSPLILKMGLDITDRKLIEESLRESRNRLRSLASQLLRAQETERKRLALELHDDLGQSLLVLKMQLSVSLRKLPPDLAPNLKQSLEFINVVIENVRRLSHNLRPSVLEDLGLKVALKGLLEDFSKLHKVQVSLEMEDLKGLLSDEAQIAIYRIFQESLTNIAKHARATQVRVTVKLLNGQVAFRIEDNGKGFDLQEVLHADTGKRGLGLNAMAERLRLLEGELHIASEPRKGTTLSFLVPSIS